ncbi:NAD(P)H-quinone oxidoreductase [Methylococcus sp. EFPC2]|nr:NAD(P)H-quinone oxidoreductase [Methylococcus sp. EFPC2]QSA99187.1 NAD(P)H-quinone oxidoreductase [Methylococcus sp. EFPC2]
MAVIEIAEPGGPEVLRLASRPIPQPGPGVVLIRVAAAGVNRPDVMQRKGLYPPPPGASDIPGLEVAGEIVAVDAPEAKARNPLPLGEGRVRAKPADRATASPQVLSLPDIGSKVCALVTGGGYAEYCLASAELCLPWPAGFDAVQAASLPETYFTVWSNLVDRARLHAGESLLVHGGSSGIGVAAIQLARALGAVVYATSGSAEKCRVCEELGAVAINYRERDFVAEIEARTEGRGVDVILDMVGGDYLQRNLSCLASEGRLVQIAVQNGPKASINLLPILLKRLTLTGSTLRARPVEQKASIAAALLERVWPLLGAGRIKPVIHARFPLALAAEAHRLMESGVHIGKIVLTV